VLADHRERAVVLTGVVAGDGLAEAEAMRPQVEPADADRFARLDLVAKIVEQLAQINVELNQLVAEGFES
jgi:hypothetical protein